VAMSKFRCFSAFTADLFLELRAVLAFDGFAAFLAGFTNGHSAGWFTLGGRHSGGLPSLGEWCAARLSR